MVRTLSRLAAVLAALSLVAVAGCKTYADYAGTGPLNLDASTSNFLDQYVKHPGAALFAVSVDGRCSSYRYCPSGGTCGGGDDGYLTIQACENSCKTPCKLLASHRTIVWNGPVRGLPDSVQRPQDQQWSRPDTAIRAAKGCADGEVRLRYFALGAPFRDCPECPEMIPLPSATYRMGSISMNTEQPIHDVTFAKPFAVGKYEVTFAEWDACVADGGCQGHSPSDQGWGRGRQPLINVNWRGAKAYVEWLSKKTGGTYRLLSESEWEYAARAGACTTYTWGNDAGTGNAVCRTCGTQWDGKQPAPVGQFRPNAFGLHDTAGNVAEWVEDCNNAYKDRPRDGSPVTTGRLCSLRQIRGGAWGQDPADLRPESRELGSPYYESRYTGFRVAKSLD